MKIALNDQPDASQKPVLKQMYPPKPRTEPPLPELPRKALTQRDCWVSIVSCLLGAVLLGVLVWDDYRHGRGRHVPASMGVIAFFLLKGAKNAWDNLQKLRRGEAVTVTVSGNSPRDYWQLGLVVATFAAVVVTGLCIVHCADFSTQGRWKPELAGLVIAWPAIIWSWKRLMKSDARS